MGENIELWEIVRGYSCRKCCDLARVDPNDGERWGCRACNKASKDLLRDFTRDADEQAKNKELLESLHRKQTREIYDAAKWILDSANEIDRHEMSISQADHAIKYMLKAELVANEIVEWYGDVLSEPEMTIEEADAAVDKIIKNAAAGMTFRELPDELRGKGGFAQQCWHMANAACEALGLPFDDASPSEIYDKIVELVMYHRGTDYACKTGNHEWHWQQIGGDPQDAVSDEMIRLCRLCGAEDPGSGTINPVGMVVNGSHPLTPETANALAEMGKAVRRIAGHSKGIP